MNRTRVQYAVIAHRQLAEVKQRLADLEQQLAQRLAALDTEERWEYAHRTGEPTGEDSD